MDENLPRDVEISVVMPCLNEADTLETCIGKAQRALAAGGLSGEVIVADNGSTDGSREIALRMGARVVPVEPRGYGNALMAGIEVARGRFVLMGDADDSYDFLEIPRFVDQLRQGYDLVQGCRLPAGGGRVLPGAMPALHRWLGNPLLTAMIRRMFQVPVHDAYCGMRAFTREFYQRLDQRCGGMEFATEMILKSALLGARVSEVPITLHPDGRTSHGPHLRTFRDGWRTVRLFLLYSPRWLFLYPGAALIVLGALGYGLALPGARIFGAQLDAHTLLFASLALLMGYQAMLFAFLGKTFGITEGLLPPDPRMDRAFQWFRLEAGLVVGAIALGVGAALLLAAIAQWRAVEFGRLDYAQTMRWVVPGVTLSALGFQTVLASFFVSLLGMRRK